ncbi:MAG: phosphoadenylyl-sulfate reductase [Alphaproteobacteria bacterium]|nr:MAG: phosphoadenylyl-sulfate reductase [Alphaproteobacteria bacterium]
MSGGEHYRTTSSLDARAAALNEAFDGLTAERMLDRLLNGNAAGRVAVVSSFGAEAAVLLKLVADKDPSTPVVFLDTLKHFDETLDYVDSLMERLGLTTLLRVRPSPARLLAEDPDGTLNLRDSDRCCYVRKTLPMITALRHFDAILTGRKRFQTVERQQMDYVEVQESWLRINPLADWSKEQIDAFIAKHDLPPNPLVAQGYPSIGCAPCTVKSDSYRDGRWADSDKSECGIHITEDGKIVQIGANQSAVSQD